MEHLAFAPGICTEKSTGIQRVKCDGDDCLLDKP